MFLALQVFFLQREEQSNGNHANYNRLIERLARAFCLALSQSLSLLKEDGLTKLALRVTLEGQKVRTLHSNATIKVLLFYVLPASIKRKRRVFYIRIATKDYSKPCRLFKRLQVLGGMNATHLRENLHCCDFMFV